MKVELTDDEVTTIMVALDSYGAQKRIEWLDTRNDDDLTEAGSSEWCWQKLFGIQQEFRNSIADAIGEGETNNLTNALIDPFGLPTWNDI
tara:strand:- start:931 stop:1200 length:270 start_codon:yes stop_codon:yes gene_type:complete